MTWYKVNLDDTIWIIPGDHMKAGRDHRVPLSIHAKAILTNMEELALGYTNIVFSGIRDRKPLSDITLTAALKRMGRTDITVHGFRSTFCDRAAEATLYSREIAEMALAHKVSYQVEVPYRHVEMFKKRRKMVPD